MGGGCYRRLTSFEDKALHSVLFIIRHDLHHPLALLKGAGVGEALTVAKGTTAMGAEGVGDGTSWLVGGVEGTEAPALAATS